MSAKTTVLTVSIPKIRLEPLERRLGEVNRRARRMGADELTLAVNGEQPLKVRRVRRVYREGQWTHEIADVIVPGITVSVEGAAPRIEGWMVAGHVNIKKAYIQAETGQVKAMPATGFLGFSDDEVRMTLVSRLDGKGRIPCDHCRTVRNRKEAFVLSREGNPAEQVVVGSECVRDFTGHDPAVILRGYRGLIDARDELERELRNYRVVEEYDWESFLSAERTSRVSLERFLAAAFESARRHGFSPDDRDGKPSAAQTAVASLRSGIEPSHEAFAVADEVIGWIPRMGYREDDLWKARRLGAEVGLDETGLAARCLLAWAQASGRPLRGGFMGDIGERIEAELTVTGRAHVDRGYSDRNGEWHGREIDLWSFKAADGSRAYWETASRVDLDEGESFTCRATVKDHVVSDRGTALTEFSRLSGISPRANAGKELSAEEETEGPKLPGP